MAPIPPSPQPIRATLGTLGALLLFGSVTPWSARAQSVPDLESEARWVDFGPESGLPRGMIQDVLEVDSVVWLFTDAGAAWYDGFEWQPAVVQGTPLQGTVTSLAPDSTGGVLLVQGARLYRGGARGLQPVPLPPPLDSMGVHTAIPFRNGGILLTPSVADPALWLLEGDEARPVPGLPEVSDQGSLFLTDAGRAWVYTHRGFYVWERGAWRSLNVPSSPFRVSAFVAEGPGGTGVVWQVADDGVLGVYRLRRDAPPHLEREEGQNTLFSADVTSDGRILALYETGDVRIWTGEAWRTLVLPPSRRNGLRLVRVTGDGDLWFGTGQGLHLFRSQRTRFSVLRRPFPNTANRVNTVLALDHDAFWVGTAGGVVLRAAGVSRWFYEGDGVSFTNITGLARDPRGRIWVSSGSAFDGVARWDGERWSHLSREEGVDVGSVHRIFAEEDETVWLAALGDGEDRPGGLFRWREGEGTVDVLRQLGIDPVRVYGVDRRNGGPLWVATARGVYSIPGDGTERNGVRFYPVDVEGREGWSRMWDVAVDPDGRPWFALNPDLRRGLLRLDGDSLVSVLPPGPDVVRKVWSLRFDERGILWMGTEGGVLSLRDGVWTTFDETAGLPSVNVWPVFPQDHRVLIGTKGGGLVTLSRREEGNPPPRVVVRTPIQEGGSVRLTFDALAWWGEIPSEEVEARTRLDGGDWGPWSTSRERVLLDLPAGRHVVEIQTKSLFGALSTPTAWTAAVPLPLPLRPAFAIPVGALLVSLLATGAASLRRRRQDQEALRLSEGRLRALVEGSLEAIGILDLGLERFVDVNENALLLTGLDRATMLTRNLLDISPRALSDGTPAGRAFNTLSQKAMRGVPQLVEWAVSGASGEEIPCDLHLSRLPSATRTLLRVSLQDVRERRRAEAQRTELEDQLRQSQKLEAVGQLTGGVAHDFNNLLTVIRGNLEMLEETAPLDAESRTLVDEAVQAAERSARLTQRLLAFSRRQTLAPTALGLHELAKDLQDLLSRSLGEVVDVTFDIPPDTWTVNVDRAQLESAVLNLCLNSRDAMPLGGRIAIQAENVPAAELDPALGDSLEATDYVRLSVSDTGSGMPTDVQERAFDPFFTTKEVGKGTGLGLSMVYGFVTQSGGTVTLESGSGMGTTVRLYLPRVARGGPASSHDAANGEVPGGRGERVLLVEDDPGVTRLLSQFLERLGYTVVTATDGDGAVGVITEGTPVDILLTDLVLPGGMSGAQVAATLQGLRPRLPVLYMSGYSEEAVTPHARPPEGSTVLRKPFDLPTLARKLRQALEH